MTDEPPVAARRRLILAWSLFALLAALAIADLGWLAQRERAVRQAASGSQR